MYFGIRIYKWTNTKNYDTIYFIENFVFFDTVSYICKGDICKGIGGFRR